MTNAPSQRQPTLISRRALAPVTSQRRASPISQRALAPVASQRRAPTARPIQLAYLLLCLAFLTGCTEKAKDATGQQRNAMKTLSGRLWYDDEKVAYRRPKVSAGYDTPIRTDGWESVPKTFTPKPTPAPGTTRPWALSLFDGSFSVLAWILIGVLLIVVAVLLAGTSVRSWSRKKVLPKKVQAIDIDPARVVDLPFESRVEMNDPLDSARRLAMAKDYNGAVLFLYGYMLLALDKAGHIVLHRGKTNRMYLFELAGHRPLKELVSPAMLAFEDVFFGRHDIDHDRFTKLWNSLETFHLELQPAMQGKELVKESAAEVIGT